MLPFKDVIKNDLEKSMVVYRLNCSCGHTYIGKADRILSERMSEHPRDLKSSCRQHVETCEKKGCPVHKIGVRKRIKDKKKRAKYTCKINYEKTEVIDRVINGRKLLYKELLHIHRQKKETSINIQHNNGRSDYEVKTLIIKSYAQIEK